MQIHQRAAAAQLARRQVVAERRGGEVEQVDYLLPRRLLDVTIEAALGHQFDSLSLIEGGVGGAHRQQLGEPLFQLDLFATRHKTGDSGHLAIAAGHMIVAQALRRTVTADLGGKARHLVAKLLAIVEGDGAGAGRHKAEGCLVALPVLGRLEVAPLQQIAKTHQIMVAQHQIRHGVIRVVLHFVPAGIEHAGPLPALAGLLDRQRLHNAVAQREVKRRGERRIVAAAVSLGANVVSPLPHLTHHVAKGAPLLTGGLARCAGLLHLAANGAPIIQPKLIGLIEAPTVDAVLLDPVAGHLLEVGEALRLAVIHQLAGITRTAAGEGWQTPLWRGLAHPHLVDVAKHPVEEDIEAALVRPIHQLFELGIAAKVGIHGEKVAGEVAGGIELVIAALPRAGVEHRGEPDGVDVETLDVVETVDDPLQIAVVLGGAIADAVVGTAVTIGKRLHHYLIDAQVAGGLIVAIAGTTGRGDRRVGDRRIDDGGSALPT